MAIKPLVQTKIPRRWCIYGPSGSGKSTFLLALKQPVLVVDADQRIVEVTSQFADAPAVFTISDDPEDHCNIERICKIIKDEVKNCAAESIFIDSLTTILSPLVQRANLDAENGKFKNRSMAFKEKALLMKMLQDVMTQTGRDIFYVWHLERGVFNGSENWNHTIPETERERLLRSSNALLQVIEKDGKRGVQIDWSRTGVHGVIIWDNHGYWDGVPERIEEAIAFGKPRFANRRKAIEWGVAQGGFSGFAEAETQYLAIAKEHSPKTAHEMFALWESAVLKAK